MKADWSFFEKVLDKKNQEDEILSELTWTTHAIMIFQMKIDLLARTAIPEKSSSLHSFIGVPQKVP